MLEFHIKFSILNKTLKKLYLIMIEFRIFGEEIDKIGKDIDKINFNRRIIYSQYLIT